MFLLRFSVASIIKTENESEGNVYSLINPLNGKHIRVLAMEVRGFYYFLKMQTRNLKHYYYIFLLLFFVIVLKITGVVMTKRNATGHVLDISGIMPLALESLSRLYKFR
jgi:hypothetical protein